VFSDSNLRAHMLVHRNKRPYHRKTCNKGFKQKHTQVPQLTGDTVVPNYKKLHHTSMTSLNLGPVKARTEVETLNAVDVMEKIHCVHVKMIFCMLQKSNISLA